MAKTITPEGTALSSVRQYNDELLLALNSALFHLSLDVPAGIAPLLPPPLVKNAPVVSAIFNHAPKVGFTPKDPVIAGSAPSNLIFGAQELQLGYDKSEHIKREK